VVANIANRRRVVDVVIVVVGPHEWDMIVVGISIFSGRGQWRLFVVARR
jgi:hypothetical protein